MSLLFSKTVFFLKNFVSLSLFRLIQSIFRSIKIVLKLFKEASVCFDWSKPILDKSKLFWNFFKIFKEVSVCFNQSKLIFDQLKIVNQVFKNQSLTFSNLLFKKVFKLFLSLRIGQGSPKIFCHFPPDFLQGFPLYKLVSPFCPSFCILFHVFMHFIGYFRNFSNWDFCWFKSLFLQLIIGLCSYNVIVMIYDG